MPPWVTALIPARDAAPYVAAAVASLAAQTYPYLRLVAVDDGSTDDTRERLDDALHRCGRPFALLHNDQPLGPAASCNRAAAVATGEYLLRSDADDISRPHRVGLQVQVMQAQPQLDVMAGTLRFIDEEGSPRRLPLSLRHRPFSPAGNHRALLIGNTVLNPTAILRRTAFEDLGGYDERTPLEDYDYFLRLRSRSGGNIATVAAQLVDYRVHPGNLSKQRPIDNHLTVTPMLAQLLADELHIEADPPLLAAMHMPAAVEDPELSRRCIALLRRLEAAVLPKLSPRDVKPVRGWVAAKRLQHAVHGAGGRRGAARRTGDLRRFAAEAVRYQAARRRVPEPRP